ncbi:molybdate ABC transporter substrate-binding protein [Cytobacillus sp. Hz8]|uniref:molybdate ABC transporter substrate-binding protein n=1 Tax=Cytobacillus sp. Hz8 TaxID=3347168 RepID=UPI0035DB8AD3
MKKLSVVIFSLIMFMFVAAGCSNHDDGTKANAEKQNEPDKKVELTISAAASLQDALTELKTTFEKENPNVKLNFNFGSSGTLQQQIAQGAPVDLFFSAAEDKFDELVHKGFIEQSKGKDLVGNDLVLIVSNDSNKNIQSFKDLSKVNKLALGTPDSVPAGQYGKETLEHFNLWTSLEKKIVYGKDVRQVLTYVETNNVDAGIVYKTDALISSKVKIVATAGSNTHGPIIYPLGIIKNSKHPKEAHLYYDFLQKESSLKILEKYGFKRIH